VNQEFTRQSETLFWRAARQFEEFVAPGDVGPLVFDTQAVWSLLSRLPTVTGPVTANFKYDGDSQRIRATINGGLDTVFIGN